MRLEAGSALGPYEILGPIGAGGMGEVFRARDTRLGREVAIKILPHALSGDPQRLARFEREARSSSALNHPNIVTIHDFTSKDGEAFLVMELIRGESLRQVIARGPLPVKKLLPIAAGVANGLAAAHAAGIVHRDLKPENVMLTADGLPKILDFGLVKLSSMPVTSNLPTEPRMSLSGAVMGTAAYMSPEQARGQGVDFRSDQFSFGLIVSEMATGKHPFERSTAVEILAAILNDDPEPLGDQFPEPFVWIVDRCLAKDPAGRYGSTADLARDLERSRDSGRSNSVDLRETKVSKIRPRIFWLSSSLAILIVIVLVTVLQFGKPSGARAKRIESIAVLPLNNLSGDPQQQYFADGMTEAFINELGQLSGLRVISRTSVMQYKETKTPLSKIAHDLRVDAVLEGSVLQAGNRVEITANLLEPRTEKRLWSKTYERDLRDILSLRKEIARAIVKEIHLTITPEERNRLATARTVDPEAYRLYLRGNFHINKQNEAAFRKAIADYQRAIEIDPNYAPAYAGMAVAYVELGSWFSTLSREEVYPKAKAAALKALELDEQLPEAHFALGYLKYMLEWDWAGADSAFRRGIELNPRSSYGLVTYANYLTAMGRFKESIGIAKRAVDIDPLYPTNYNELSFSYWFAGNRKVAYEQIGKSLELAPDFPQTVIVLAMYYAMDRKYEEAIREYHKLYGDNPEKLPTSDSGYLGWMYSRAGRRAEASMLLENLSRRPETKKAFMASLALIHLGLGDEDRSVEMLEKAYENHETSLVWLKTFPFYNTLRNHPRFQALLRRMNFPS